jgi:hypothetical protein
MFQLRISGRLLHTAERILTALAAFISGIISISVCSLLQPEISNPMALLGSAIFAMALFFNLFGITVLLFLLPLEVITNPNTS